MRKGTMVSLLGLWVATACNGPVTAPGTSLLKTTFSEAQGGPPSAVVAAQSGGGALSASLEPGASPVNRGTVESVLASLPLMIEWRQQRLGSSSLRQTMIEVVADGTAKAL